MVCRIKALLEELKKDWDQLNLAAKSLVFVGGLLFVLIIYFTIFGSRKLEYSNKIEVIFRSSLASVFGFILSSNTKNRNNNKQFMRKSYGRDINDKDNYSNLCDGVKGYDYGEGNSVQIIIALVTSISSAMVILVIYSQGISYDEGVLSQFRDFMCTSIGFLIGESKIRSD
ncbi:hypothetical protein [Terrisporobacter sp.]